jgi:hypothetical protein
MQTAPAKTSVRLVASQPFAKKTFAVIKAVPGMSLEDFNTCYEGAHSALLREAIGEEIAANRIVYNRNYLTPLGDEAGVLALSSQVSSPLRNAADAALDEQLQVGCVTELGFRYEEDYNRFMTVASDPGYVSRAHKVMAPHVAQGYPYVKLVECWETCLKPLASPDEPVALRLFEFIPEHADISRSQFIAHYEAELTKLLAEPFEEELLGGYVTYRRNYVLPAANDSKHAVWTARAAATPTPFSCCAEIAFSRSEDRDKLQRLWSDPGFAERRRKLRQSFGDTRLYSVECRSR